MYALIQRRPLLTFFVLSYLGSWVVWSPWWLSQSGLGILAYQLPFSAIAGINQLGLFAGPFAAALLVTRIAEGRGGLHQLLNRIFQWRVGAIWYILALVIVPVATGIGYLLIHGYSAVSGGIAVVGLLVSTFFIYLLGGPIQEEPGWRGFALPRLQRRFHPMTSALVLGVIHCFWHAPLFLTDEWDTARQDPSQYLAYLILIVSLSIILSWLTNGSRGSILIAVLAHNALNWALFTAGTLTGHAVVNNWPAAIGLTALALIVAVITRGRLGYKEITG